MLALSFGLPVTDPVMIFALAMLVFVSIPLFFERLRIPGIIGLIVAGALVGPNALGLLERSETIVLLGTVGLLYLMFMAGIEIDLHGFKKYRNRSLVFGGMTFLLPQLLGTGVGLALGYGIAASILLASMFASHTLVAYPIASRLGIARNEAVTTTVGGTIITDSAALLVLAVIASSVEGELNAAFWIRLTLSLTVFVAVVMLGLPRLGRWFFRQHGDGGPAEYVFVLAALFVCAVLAEVAGVEPIIGAFLAGLAINRLIPESGALSNRLHFFGNAFFIPFFLFSVGMLVDVRVLAGSARAWQVMIGMTVTVVATKWLAAKLTERIFRYTPEEGWMIFGLSVPQAAATLAAALIGYQIQLFDDAVLNGSILMILVTCTIGPWVTEKYGRRLALRAERQPYRPSEAPQRILLAISNPGTAEPLMDLALLLRDSPEPLYPLVVVPGRGEEDATAQLVGAEKLLSRTVAHAAGAGVPVAPLTRVDHNFASGIARAITETRATTVVLGWERRRSHRFALSGSVLERLIRNSAQQLLVARVEPPLNTLGRVVLVLPPCSERGRGFCEAVRTVKILANRLGAGVLGLVVEGNCTDYERIFEQITPAAPVSFEAITGWNALLPALQERVGTDDLVVVMSARPGTIAWHRQLDRLPWELEHRFPGNVVTLYPSEVEAPESADVGTHLPDALIPEHVVLDLPRVPFQEAIRQLLAGAQSLNGLGEPVAEALIRRELEDSSEVAPGVVAPSARVEGLDEPLVLLGISPEGVEFPGARAPAHFIFLLLSPEPQRETHLRLLGEIRRMVHDNERLRELLQSRSVESVLEGFRTDGTHLERV